MTDILADSCQQSGDQNGPAHTDIFATRRRESVIFIGALLLLGILSSRIADFSLIRLFKSIPGAFQWMFENFIPNAGAMVHLEYILEKLIETVFISIVATTVSAFCAFWLAVLGSRAANAPRIFSFITLFISSLFRNIPIAAWALIFLFSFGQTPFSGFLALVFTSFGFLTRVFMESINTTSAEPVEALRASGANSLQTLFQAVIPASLPQLVSWMLFMLETNIRSATLVGMLTGSGIGFAFQLYYRNLNYPAAGLLAFMLVCVVLLIENVSNAIRRAIL